MKPADKVTVEEAGEAAVLASVRRRSFWLGVAERAAAAPLRLLVPRHVNPNIVRSGVHWAAKRLNVRLRVAVVELNETGAVVIVGRKEVLDEAAKGVTKKRQTIRRDDGHAQAGRAIHPVAR